MSHRRYWKKPIMDSKKLSFYMAYFLPFGKAFDTIIPSLPRVRGSLLQRHPWTPWTYGILNFCNVKVRIASEILDHFQNTFGCHQYRILTWQSVPRPFRKQIQYIGSNRIQRFQKQPDEPCRNPKLPASRFLSIPCTPGLCISRIGYRLRHWVR